VDENYYPKYFYKSFDRASIGCVLPVFDSGIVVMPEISLKTIFMGEFSNGNRLGGNNQWEFGLRTGYAI
jgi:hypothetical protein